MKHLLIAMAAMLVASQAVLSNLASDITHQSVSTVADVLPLILLLSAPAACGLLAAPRLAGIKETRTSLLLMMGTGLLMRLVWFGAPAPIEDDFYRYLWDGAVGAAGLDPYRFSPEDALSGKGLPEGIATLAISGHSVLQNINFPNLTSIYPGAAQLSFALAHIIAPWKLDGLRLVFLIAEAATLALAMKILLRLGRPRLFAALYWCNPLIVFATTATAHVDALLPPLVLGALLTSYQRRLIASAALLAAAVGIKLWPLLLAPLLLRHTTRREAVVPVLVFAALVTAAVTPVLLATLSSQSGLAAYAKTWQMNNAPYAWASYALELVLNDEATARRLLRLALFTASVAIALRIASRPVHSLGEQLARVLTIAAMVFYLSPSQFPWYALWFLPLAAVHMNWPLLLASATLPTYYLFFPLARSDEHDVFQFGLAFLHVTPVMAWLLIQKFGKDASPRLAEPRSSI